MALSKAIKFRYLAAQLTQTEIVQFINKLLNSPNNVIITSLFNYFINSSRNHDTEPIAENINKLLSNIIQSRKKKSKSSTQSTQFKLNQLPSSLIGVTASFLSQYDYINFSKTSRSLFLGCNAPNSLQLLDLLKIKNYSSINLSLFPSLKTLKLNLDKFNQLIPAKHTSSIMNELQIVTLDADKKADFDIDTFMNQTHINMTNVIMLSCQMFGRDAVFGATKFKKLLTKFPNVQYLKLHGFNSDIDANSIKMIYPNLRGLEVFVFPEATQRELVNVMGDRLEYLCIQNYCSSEYNLYTNNFHKLQELTLTGPTMKCIDDILKTAINLKKVFIATKIVDKAHLNPKQTKDAIINCITKCKRLEYIGFKDDGDLIQSFLEGVEKGLFQNKKQKRKALRISIVTGYKGSFQPKECIFNIGGILHWLEISKIDNFMFILNVRNSKNELDNEFITELKDISTNIKVIQYGSKVVITNKNCQLNGYATQLKLDDTLAIR